jgi:prophage regulatory protein
LGGLIVHSIIRVKEVIKRLSVSRSTIFRLESQGKFIPRVQISARTVGYLEADVEEYLKRHTIANNKKNIAVDENKQKNN